MKRQAPRRATDAYSRWVLIVVSAVAFLSAACIIATNDTRTSARESSPVPGAPHDGRLAFLRHDGTYWQVWTLDLESGRERQLTHSSDEKARISWYPDGSAILVSTLDGRLLKVDARTGEPTPIPVSLPGARDAVLSPDGSKVAVSLVNSEVLDTNEIHILDASGANLRKLLRIREFQHEPQWSAESDAVYFLSFSRGNLDHDVWRASLDGRSLERLTTGSAYHLDLSVAAGGRLAFSNNRTGDYEIWTWDSLAGTAPVRQTDSPGLDGGPAWGPREESLVFHSTRSGSLQLWSLSLASGALVQLTRDTSPSRGAVWWWP